MNEPVVDPGFIPSSEAIHHELNMAAVGHAWGTCLVHKVHSPNTIVNEKHHIWPKGNGGPTVPENLVVVCATGHNSIHALLHYFVKLKGDVPWDVRRHFHPGERALAKLGYERITRKAL
jgi:hypothetical protein